MKTSRILKHLAFNVCPTCAAAIRSEEYTGRTHCNGQQFESITFQCGSKIEWIPNFDREEIATPCPKSPDVVAKANRRADISTTILKALEPMKLTDEEQQAVNRFINWGIPR